MERGLWSRGNQIWSLQREKVNHCGEPPSQCLSSFKAFSRCLQQDLESINLLLPHSSCISLRDALQELQKHPNQVLLTYRNLLTSIHTLKCVFFSTLCFGLVSLNVRTTLPPCGWEQNCCCFSGPPQSKGNQFGVQNNPTLWYYWAHGDNFKVTKVILNVSYWNISLYKIKRNHTPKNQGNQMWSVWLLWIHVLCMMVLDYFYFLLFGLLNSPKRQRVAKIFTHFVFFFIL